MSAFKPRTAKTGKGNERTRMPDMPHVSSILRKPKNLGAEHKVSADAERRIATNLEVQRGEDGMADAEHARELGGQVACAIRLMEASIGCGRNPEDVEASASTAQCLVAAFFGLAHSQKCFSSLQAHSILGRLMLPWIQDMQAGTGQRSSLCWRS